MLIRLLACFWIVLPGSATAQQASGASDFDWEFGRWTTHVEVRAPLDPNASWSLFDGVSDIRPLSEGRANIVDLSLTGAQGGRIEGVSLRLFHPDSGQWSLHFASTKDGVLTAPVFGAFVGGRGVFHGQDTVAGRAVLVRFVISDATPTSARFVQSYSDDGGQTWIDNWIASDVRQEAPAAE